MARELTFNCTDCSQPIDDGRPGSLEIIYQDINACQEQRAAWHAKQVENAGDGLALATYSEVANYPDPARWQAFHDDCTASSSGGYYIPASELQTWQDLVAKTAHLMGKSWLECTDWNQVLRDVVQGRGAVRLPVGKA